jgi:hypothetical protein
MGLAYLSGVILVTLLMSVAVSAISEADNLAKIPRPYYLSLACPGMTPEALMNATGLEIPRPYDSKVFRCSNIATYVQWRLMSRGYDAEICMSNHFKHFSENGSSGHAWVRVKLSGKYYYIDGNAGYDPHTRVNPNIITLYLHSPDQSAPDFKVYGYYNQPERVFIDIYKLADSFNLDGWDWWNSTSQGNTGLNYQEEAQKISEGSTNLEPSFKSAKSFFGAKDLA